MICIDSDCIIDFLKGEKKAVGIITSYKEEIATTEINVFEVYFGIYLRESVSQKEEDTADLFLSSIEMLSSNNGWGKQSAKLIADLAKQGRIIDKNDCFISSIMKANNCNKIITRNVKHFCRIKGIEIIPY